MKHPFQYCAITDWLCCVHVDSEVTCCIFAVIGIVVMSFMGLTNVGLWHWAVYLASIWNFAFHLIAGVILFLGALWGRELLKLVYCWLCLLNIITDICSIVAFAILYKSIYMIWYYKCDEYYKSWGLIIPFLNYIFLLIWDILSPMVVLGNLDTDKDIDSVDEDR